MSVETTLAEPWAGMPDDAPWPGPDTIVLLDRDLVAGTDRSELSRFADDRWRFNDAIFEHHSTSVGINFTLVPAPLRLAAKHYMWQLINIVAPTPMIRRTAATRPSLRSVMQWFSTVKEFLIWLDPDFAHGSGLPL